MVACTFDLGAAKDDLTPAPGDEVLVCLPPMAKLAPEPNFEPAILGEEREIGRGGWRSVQFAASLSGRWNWRVGRPLAHAARLEGDGD